MNRRSFLKLLGATAATTVVASDAPKILTPTPTAPLYVPSERLDMGVPRRILTATEMPPTFYRVEGELGLQPVGEIPMLLVNAEFRPPGYQQYGQDRVPAGTTLLVDRRTAERWIEHGVGTPGPSAPLDLQEASVKRWAERRRPEPEEHTWDPGSAEAYDWAPGVYTRSPAGSFRDRQVARDRGFGRVIERASARLERAAPSPEMAWWDEPAIGEEVLA